MNDRIKELASEADDWADKNYGNDDFDVYEAMRERKFAELIIQECAKIGEIKEQGFGDYDPNISVGWYMRKHFGVK